MRRAALMAGLLALPLPARAAPEIERGRRVYARACATCHGRTGQGDGPTAARLGIAPRNLTTGIYRFRTTPSGSLPTDDDLLRTITWGVPGTEMPAWGDVLALDDRRAVVAFVKALSPRFAAEPPTAPVAFPPASTDTPALRDRGRALWGKMQCAACHGEGGRGDGPSMPGLRDDEGRPLPAADLTRWRYKGGTQRADVERAILTGLDGAAMPSYGESLAPEEVSALGAYVLSLRGERSLLDWLLEDVR